MTAPNEIEKQRLDLFAAAALTGLLASGQFTENTEDGLWAILQEDWHDDEGNGTMTPRNYSPAPELAWLFAEWMIREQPKTQTTV